MRENVVADIAQSVEKLYEEVIDPIAQKFEFERAPHKSERTAQPLVLFIGNHSSGKSTFINYLLGATVQKTGVAPTDDCFTIVTFGEKEADLQGPTITTDQTMAYTQLERLGPDFVRHLRMKLRNADILKGLSLVDTPGMIDSAGGKTRVYDFTAAVRWFAERADVVLFFFDPEKPGTTGETLEVLKVALLDLEHKVHFVLNKVDRFERIEDFARTYGALCWNLSKVILSKDLPHIDNVFIPRADADLTDTELPLDSFAAIREKLVGQVKRAPDLREENIITRLDDHAKRLLLHVQICGEARKEYRRQLWRFGMTLALGGVASLLITALFLSVEPWYVPLFAFVVCVLLLANYGFYAFKLVKEKTRSIVSDLDELFERTFRREIEEENLDLPARWKRIRKRTRQVLKRVGLDKMPRLRRDEEKQLETAINKTIASMRGKRRGVKLQEASA